MERLARLLVGSAASLGPFGLGRARSRHDYEVYAGFDFTRKRAHPDVFTGANPDPVTIHNEEDWRRCVTFEEFQRLHAHSDRRTGAGA